jgi:anti-sigma B factor antagonist
LSPCRTGSIPPENLSEVQALRIEDVRIKLDLNEVSSIPVVTVTGEIDVCTAPEFKSVVNKAIFTGAQNLIVDLTDVSYMDSSGFGTLLGATKRIKPRGGSVNLVGCSEAIERMLKITRLDTIFGMFPRVDDAVQGIRAT